MKRKSIFAVLFAGLMLAASVSCEKGTNETVNSEIGQESPVSKQIEGIPKDVTRLSEMDAVNVADMFLSSSDKLKTRSFSNKHVRSIVPVNGTDGEPAFYAVNYDDGFLWVSATKKLYPILAIVDHGSFDTAEDVGMGIDIVKDELVTASESLAFEDIPESVRRAWREYEEKDAPVMPESISTKAYSKDYLNALDKVYSYAAENGYDVYKLDDMIGPEGVTSNKVPEEVLKNFYDLVYEDYTFGEEASNMAYVLKKSYCDEAEYGPFTKTTWNQDWPYNSGLDDTSKYLGCMTIATAQFMRYFEEPDVYSIGDVDYHWVDMPNRYSNHVLSAFLADLMKRLNITESGLGTMKSAFDVLISFGYDVVWRDYNGSALNASLERQNVVILDGRKSKGAVGHGWVCDGYQYEKYYTDYKLFALDNAAYPDYVYVCMSDRREEDYGAGDYYYHMNWGWGGSSNGWFHKEEWRPLNGSTVEDFTYKPTMIMKKL